VTLLREWKVIYMYFLIFKVNVREDLLASHVLDDGGDCQRREFGYKWVSVIVGVTVEISIHVRG